MGIFCILGFPFFSFSVLAYLQDKKDKNKIDISSTKSTISEVILFLGGHSFCTFAHNLQISHIPKTINIGKVSPPKNLDQILTYDLDQILIIKKNPKLGIRWNSAF